MPAAARSIAGSPPSARHWASSDAAAGEFLARAERAASQIGIGAPEGVEETRTLPRDLTRLCAAWHCASKLGAAGEFRARAERAASQMGICVPDISATPLNRASKIKSG